MNDQHVRLEHTDFLKLCVKHAHNFLQVQSKLKIVHLFQVVNIYCVMLELTAMHQEHVQLVWNVSMVRDKYWNVLLL